MSKSTGMNDFIVKGDLWNSTSSGSRDFLLTVLTGKTICLLLLGSKWHIFFQLLSEYKIRLACLIFQRLQDGVKSPYV